MRSPTTPLVLTALLLAALPVVAIAQQEDDDAFLRVAVPEEGEDRIHRLRTQVRHTTVIVLPAGENILDFVVGDSEYWHLAGAANVAFLKPLRPEAATNIALVCESGRIYSFLVAEHSDGPPHLVVRVESGTEKTGLSGGGSGRPAFVARSEVAAYQQMAAEAAETARSAREAAEAGILEARSQAESAIEAFRAGYPERLAFEYRLDGDAADRPFLVEAMWHDGQFTYLRSHAQESPALYELRDGEPALVAYDLTDDGLYIARHVLGDGWLADRRQAGRLAVHAQGRAPMSRWKQWVRPPEGALPGGIVTKAGVVLIAVLVGGLLLLVGDDGSRGRCARSRGIARGAGGRRRDGEVAPGAHSARGRAADSGGRRPGARRAAESSERRQAAAAEEMARLQTESETPNTAALIPGVSAAESELREALRRNAGGGARERRTRSLRALPVAQSYRDPNATAESSEAGTGDAGRRGCGPPREHGPSGSRLIRAVGRGARGRIGSRPGGRTASPSGPLASPLLRRPRPGSKPPVRHRARFSQGVAFRPADPPGWERIYEGSFRNHPRGGAAHSALEVDPAARRERAGLVRRPDRERQPVKSTRKSLWLLDHRLGVSVLCPQSCPIIVPASSGRHQRP